MVEKLKPRSSPWVSVSVYGVPVLCWSRRGGCLKTTRHPVQSVYAHTDPKGSWTLSKRTHIRLVLMVVLCCWVGFLFSESSIRVFWAFFFINWQEFLRIVEVRCRSKTKQLLDISSYTAKTVSRKTMSSSFTVQYLFSVEIVEARAQLRISGTSSADWQMISCCW